jgi:hypothetical protein
MPESRPLPPVTARIITRTTRQSHSHSTKPYCTEPGRTEQKSRPHPAQAALGRKDQMMGSRLLGRHVLEVGHAFRSFVVAAALHLDLGRGMLDLGEFVGR